MVVVSSTLVNVSDDAEVRLVSLLTEGAPTHLLSPDFQTDCQKAIELGDAGSLLSIVLNDSGAMSALLSLEVEESVAAFSLLSALLERTGKRSQALAQPIIHTTSFPDKEERKISLLATLYNMQVETVEKVELLRQMIEIAGACTSRNLLAPNESLGRLLSCDGDEESSSPLSTSSGRCLDASLPPIVTLLNSWRYQDRIAIYRTITDLLPAADIRKQRFLLLLVASYTTANGSNSDPAVEVAVEAAVGAIRNPISLFMLQRNLLTYPAIQAIKGKHPVLLGLLQIFQENTLTDYKAYLQSHGGVNGVLVPWNLDGIMCERHMRILSLCDVAANREEISYAEISDTLQLSGESEVESWVIAAVSSKLLLAKMDQLRHVVLVERSLNRRFGMEQWKVIQNRLRIWKQNVGNILTSFKDSQPTSTTREAVSHRSRNSTSS